MKKEDIIIGREYRCISDDLTSTRIHEVITIKKIGGCDTIYWDCKAVGNVSLGDYVQFDKYFEPVESNESKFNVGDEVKHWGENNNFIFEGVVVETDASNKRGFRIKVTKPMSSRKKTGERHYELYKENHTALVSSKNKKDCPFEIGQVRKDGSGVYTVTDINHRDGKVKIVFKKSGNSGWYGFVYCVDDEIVTEPETFTDMAMNDNNNDSVDTLHYLVNEHHVNCGFKLIGIDEAKKYINNPIWGEREEDMFSICDYRDEILTGLKGLKVFQKRKYEKAFNDNQVEINRQINSEFWEDGTIPKKERVIELLKEKMGDETDTTE